MTSNARRAAGETVGDIRLRDVRKEFGAVTAVRDVSFSVERGRFFSLLGPSGCGKTTTLRLIAGFEMPTSGEVWIRGKDVTRVPPYRRDFGMVFQNFALFPHLTVAENVAFGLRMRNVPSRERAQRVREALDLVKLSGLGSRRIKQLSGGQQQRVALARAIVVRPAVLLLDEPLSALDKNLREEMQIELRRLQHTLGITMVFVTHDQQEALTLSDEIAVMNNGVIEQMGSPRELYERPSTEFIAGFLGTSNFFNGRVVGRMAGRAIVEIAGWRFPVSGDAPVGATVRIALRPESIRIRHGSLPDGLQAKVGEIVYRGSTTHVFLESAAGPFVAFQQNADPGSATATHVGADVTCSWSDDSGTVVRVDGRPR